MTRGTKIFTFFFFLLLVLPALVVSKCTCDKEEQHHDKAKALKYKIIAIASIIITSSIGVLTPFVGKFVPAFSPEKDIFFIIKAFAASVILSTGFIHVLPEAYAHLTSPCLSDHPWGDFPFTGFVAICTAMGTPIVDTFATAYFKRVHTKKIQIEAIGDDEEKNSGHEGGHVHQLHNHITTHGHAHRSVDSSQSSQILRHRVISQVLELGMVVHSVMIGISMGTSESPKTNKASYCCYGFSSVV